MILKGFRFGLLLQLAVGPMCLLVFNTSVTEGLLTGLLLVVAITLIDALYITLSGLGIAAVINKNGVRFIIKVFGCIVLVLFGVSTISGAFNYSILPTVQLFEVSSDQNVFIKGLLLTASNPLTIIFWSGVFSSRVSEDRLSRHQLCCFGIGCVLSTTCFLGAVAVLGSVVSGFLPALVIKAMNVAVGLLLIGFGVRLFVKKDRN